LPLLANNVTRRRTVGVEVKLYTFLAPVLDAGGQLHDLAALLPGKSLAHAGVEVGWAPEPMYT